MRERLIKDMVEEHQEGLDLVKHRGQRFTRLHFFSKQYFERVATSADREAYKHDLPGF